MKPRAKQDNIRINIKQVDRENSANRASIERDAIVPEEDPIQVLNSPRKKVTMA